MATPGPAPGTVGRAAVGRPSPWTTLGRVNLGPQELIIVLVIVLVLFGGAKLPKLARSLGQAQKEFRQGMDEGAKEDDTAADDEKKSG